MHIASCGYTIRTYIACVPHACIVDCGQYAQCAVGSGSCKVTETH